MRDPVDTHKNTIPVEVALQRDLLSIRDLMAYTAESESAWRKRLGRREIAYIRIGTNVRVRRKDLEAWLEARKVPAAEPVLEA